MTLSCEAIEQAALGDREAQRLIFESLSDRVHRLVLRIVGSTDADDVTQDVFIHLFANLHQYRHDAQLSTWVYRLAVNEALQHLRRTRRRSVKSLDGVNVIARSQGNAAEMKELLETALGRIDAELRIVLELKEIEGMSYTQIAEIVGIPEGTVGSRLNRARRELRSQLEALGWEG